MQTFQPYTFYLLCYLDKLNLCTMLVDRPALIIISYPLNTRSALNKLRLHDYYVMPLHWLYKAT